MNAPDYKVVLANGAFKSGSTWLRDIVKCFRAFDPIPPAYQDRRFEHWISEVKIEALLRDERHLGVYLSKSHLYLPEVVRGLLAYENLRVLNIKRDYRDVVVSAYYHYCRTRKVKMTFDRYYWRIGRYRIVEIMDYHRAWDLGDPTRVLLTSYERLQGDFGAEVRRLAGFLEVDLDGRAIEDIRERTSLENLRRLRGEDGKPEEERFFRKGIVGDWENHFTDDQMRDFERITREGLQGGGRLLYWLVFPCRRRLQRLGMRMRLA